VNYILTACDVPIAQAKQNIKSSPPFFIAIKYIQLNHIVKPLLPHKKQKKAFPLINLVVPGGNR